MGFVDFTKLLFALSSLAQPLKRVRSIPEHFFVILSQRKACTGRFREDNLVEAHCYGIRKGSGHVLSNHVAVNG